MNSLVNASARLGDVDGVGRRASTAMVVGARASINKLTTKAEQRQRGTGLDDIRNISPEAHLPREKRWLLQHWVRVLASDATYRSARQKLMDATTKLRHFVLDNLKANDEMLEAHGVLLAWMPGQQKGAKFSTFKAPYLRLSFPLRFRAHILGRVIISPQGLVRLMLFS